MWFVYETDSEADYGAGFFTCTATLVLDKAQAQAHKADEARHREGLNPDRARQWTTYTADEGTPTIT